MDGAELIDWLVSSGGKVDVGFGRNAAGVRGLQYARPACAPGDCLIKVPAHLALPLPYTDSAYSAPWLLRQVLFHSGFGAAGRSGSERGSNSSSSSSSETTDCPVSQEMSILDADIAARPFVESQPGPADVLSGYNWPEEMIPLLATPQLERLVRIFKGRAARVHATGLQALHRSNLQDTDTHPRGSQNGRAAAQQPAAASGAGTSTASPAAVDAASSKCRGARFSLSLAEAELWAQDKCLAHHHHHCHHRHHQSCSSPQPWQSHEPTQHSPEVHEKGEQEHRLRQQQQQEQQHQHQHRKREHGQQQQQQQQQQGEGEHPPPLPQHATLQDVEWAASVICTRSFSTAFDSLMAIVPLVDMTNHVNSGATATVESSSEDEEDASEESHGPYSLPASSRHAWRHTLPAQQSPLSGRSEAGQRGGLCVKTKGGYVLPVWGSRKDSVGGNNHHNYHNHNNYNHHTREEEEWQSVGGRGGPKPGRERHQKHQKNDKNQKHQKHQKSEGGCSGRRGDGAWGRSGRKGRRQEGGKGGCREVQEEEEEEVWAVQGLERYSKEQQAERQEREEQLQRQMCEMAERLGLEPEQFSHFRRRPWLVKSAAELHEGDEVTFTYHQGLRDDEILVYYGFLPEDTQAAQKAPDGLPLQDFKTKAPELMAVDHPDFQTVSSDSEDRDLYDEQGSLVIDPLDGCWRGSTSKFQGTIDDLQAELQRLTGLLADLDVRERKLMEQEATSGQAFSCVSLPWLPAVIREFRRRRRTALQLEIARLEGQLSLQQLECEKASRAGSGVRPEVAGLVEGVTGMGLHA